MVCAIENYEPFDVPVPAKNDGVAYERIGTSLVGVPAYARFHSMSSTVILSAAHSRTPTSDSGTRHLERNAHRRRRSNSSFPANAKFRAVWRTSGGSRRSDRARAVGDWAEERVLKHLRERLLRRGRDSLRWVAREGKTPGWTSATKATMASSSRSRSKVQRSPGSPLWR